MFIAIEGMDGVGKSTLAKKISSAFDFTFVEKPIQRTLNITDSQYNDLSNSIWSKDNNNLTLIFFLLGNIITRYCGENIVADRHILSSYYWDGNESNRVIFDYFYKGDIIPDLTFVLYADEETRYNRIKKRNSNDADLQDSVALRFGYDKMIRFANEINLSYILVDTAEMDEIDTFKYCSNILKKFIKCNNLGDVKNLIDFYNNYFYDNKKQEKKLLLRKK